MTPNQVIKHFGGVAETAIALNKTPRCVQKWVAAKQIPVWSQLAIQTVTKAALKAEKNK